MTEKQRWVADPGDTQRDPRDAPFEGRAGAALMLVIIPCYNQAHFLDEAIESVLSQSYPHFEIVVVDDGSTDNTAEVAARYPRVHYIRQDNQGPSSARNSGLAQSKGEYVVFLDADDRLLPDALKAGLECFEAHPECAFVSGHFRYIAGDGSPLATKKQTCPDRDHYLEMLRGNYLGMHGTYMYRRDVLESVGGFDTSLRFCEDSDLHLRIGRKFPVYCHDKVVAEWRHGHTSPLYKSTSTRNPTRMLNASVAVLRSQWSHVKGDKRYEEALKRGIESCQDFYGMQLVYEIRTHVREHEWKRAGRGMLAMLRHYPRGFASLYEQRRLARQLRAGKQRLRELRRSLVRESRKLKQLRKQEKRLWLKGGNRPLWLRIESERGFQPRTPQPPVGEARFGGLRRLRPISGNFEFNRGQPIDRYYIENFLARQSGDIRGRVLEIADASYTRKYGGDRVEVSDVLDLAEDNKQATIVACLTRAEHVPSDTFDCVILTQTLHLIYDLRSAIQTLHRILKPGGVLLATFPGISQIGCRGCSDYWCWSFTQLSARRLFEEAFPARNIEVEAQGNVLAAISFLRGLAVEELRQEELDYHDPDYEVLIALRALKPEVELDDNA